MRKLKLIACTLALGLLCSTPLVAKASFTDKGNKATFTSTGVYVLGFTGSNDGYAAVGVYGVKFGKTKLLISDTGTNWAQTSTIFAPEWENPTVFCYHDCRTDSARTEVR
ncbi:hypothetical protein SAMN05444401_0112 [Clostridium amylolyticum]|uniref:Uncharacterized protein n=1 Tax=Clostridium amylolyticum TaxID=1121298 RepID=A0A1M6N6P5_9CLOT|nr:hypothetical protein [Clostridium amylolyticum]SHJ91293.1 hypothetical protein SAMN05444401_0112 [Clostridium amylolyticum]